MKRKLIYIIIVFLLISGCSKVPEEISSSDFLIDEQGHLIFKGFDLGEIRGEDGINGIDGINGKDGRDGTNGEKGLDGNSGLNGKSAIETEYFQYIDLSEYEIGDSIPFDAGNIPFTWRLEDSKWIKIEEIKLKLINKFTIENSKSNLDERIYSAFYPYVLEMTITGTTIPELAGIYNVVVILTDGQGGHGGGSDIDSYGKFEVKEIFGVHNYFKLVFNKAYFE